MFQYFKCDDNNSEITTPYYKAHLENGYDAILTGMEGNTGKYKLILFNERNIPIKVIETSQNINDLKTLYVWANAEINIAVPRITVIKEAICYLDRHVVSDAELWASLTRQLRIIEAKLKKNL